MKPRALGVPVAIAAATLVLGAAACGGSGSSPAAHPSGSDTMMHHPMTHPMTHPMSHPMTHPMTEHPMTHTPTP